MESSEDISFLWVGCCCRTMKVYKIFPGAVIIVLLYYVIKKKKNLIKNLDLLFFFFLIQRVHSTFYEFLEYYKCTQKRSQSRVAGLEPVTTLL